MRLIDTKTIKLHEFTGNIPYYAVLSHRWGDQEVTFEDLRNDNARQKTGYEKILNCCKQAALDSWGFVVSCLVSHALCIHMALH